MCSSPSCEWYECAVPFEPYEYGMLDTLRPGPDGMSRRRRWHCH